MITGTSGNTPTYSTEIVGPFAFAFKVFTEDDVKVVRGGVLQTLNATYTVALNANQETNPGGTFTLDSALVPPETVYAYRNVSPTQGADLQNAGGMYPQVIEDALDRLTMLVQQLSAGVAAAPAPLSNAQMDAYLATVAAVAANVTGAVSPVYFGGTQALHTQHVGSIFVRSGAAACDLTLPDSTNDAVIAGSKVTIINPSGFSSLTIHTDLVYGTNVLYLSPGGTTGTRTLAANGVAHAILYQDIPAKWIIYGTGLT
jgi:hypothetical protein